MTFDGDMAVDTAVIHPVPMPGLFVRGKSDTRRIQVALAFDPPVRRQRREYLAGRVQMDLYRAIDIDDLAEIVTKQDPNDPNSSIKDRRKVKELYPGVDSLRSGTLQVRVWESRRPNIDDGDVYFLVVTHAAQPWARDRDDYQRQRYALAVTLEDQGRLDLDLYNLVTQQVRVPARIKLRP